MTSNMTSKNLLDIKHVKINAIINLISKLLTAVIMFAFAKLIITLYGDEINGIVRSTTMITGYFTIADAGVAAIVSQRLYKVIVADEVDEINRIMSASKKMFKFISLIFAVIAITISVIYPLLISRDSIIDYQFTLALLFILSIKVIPTYLWSIHYNILLTNTQKGYLYKAVTLIVYLFSYTIAALMLYFLKPQLTKINAQGKEILILSNRYENFKWVIIGALGFPATSEFLIAFIVYKIVKKKFPWLKFVYTSWKSVKELWKDAKYTLASQITWLIVFSTDEIVLTIYSHKVGATYALYLVSLLSLYGMIITTIRSVMDNIFSSVMPYLGLKTKGEENIDSETFKLYYLTVFFTSLFITFALMVATPIFVQGFFSSGGTDYLDIKIAGLASLNCFLYLIMSPYKTLFYIKGHFSRLLIPNIIEATLNLVGSLIVVWFFGVYGILMVTTVAMTYRYIHFSIAGRKSVQGASEAWHNLVLILALMSQLIIITISFVVPIYVSKVNVGVVDSISYIATSGIVALTMISMAMKAIKKVGIIKRG